MKKNTMFSLIVLSIVVFAFAQQTSAQERQSGAAATATRSDALDPRNFDPAVDPDIDLFINDWRNAIPRTMYGALVFRDILTPLEGPDPLHPVRKGAVLEYMKAVSYVTLDSGATAKGHVPDGDQQMFFGTRGAGTITVNSKTVDIGEGSVFTITPDTDFVMTCTGDEQLAFYVRTEPLPDTYEPDRDINVTNRFETNKSVRAHWAHVRNGGGFISMDARTIPQPHSHGEGHEECWIMTENETVLLLGKQVLHMTPGMAYKIPQTGLTAHTNINMGDEPVQMIVMISRAPEVAPGVDYGSLGSSTYDEPNELDVDMFMGNWRDSFPRIMHDNFYFRDMLTAFQGDDVLDPVKKGACLTNAEAVSYAYLEPRTTAHPAEGELDGIQQTFVVSSGAAIITSGSKTVNLEQDMSFIITPGLDFTLTATGDEYFSCYVVSEKIPRGFTPNKALVIVDNRGKAPTLKNWVDMTRTVITRNDGMCQYDGVNMVEMEDMTMQRPYSAATGVEEIWIAAGGNLDMLFGKKLRSLPAGTAYRVPSSGITAHANINTSGSAAKLIYMVK